MKNIVVIMNTDRTGGAERSLIIQLINQKENFYHFLIPNVSGSNELEKLIKSYGFNSFNYYEYPRSLYNLSRKSYMFNFNLVKDLIALVFNHKGFEKVKEADIVYINGIKAAFLFFIKNNLLKFQKNIVWHFRDYWYQGKITNFFWKIIVNGQKDNLQIVCNSQSTLNSLFHSPWATCKQKVIYNPSGLHAIQRSNKPVKVLGFVSMIAPWKGIHEVVLWAKLYEKELKNLGIEKIKFFGADLYTTNGEHVGYAQQLNHLLKKLNPELVSFEGNREPQEMFSNIDCLIHYSLEPEPFGRVIIEAFNYKVPTISTGMGGAAELLIDNITGIKTQKYDKQHLFESVKKIITDNNFRQKITENAFHKSVEIEKNIDLNMHQVLQEVAV
jgi:glycosyltransferase involved in cell wall biosynthesis